MTAAPDPIFADPRLARIYDAFDGPRDDLSHYLAIVKELGAKTVIDLGCGTGAFAHILAASGLQVVGVEPAKASLDVARAKPDAGRITWLEGDASVLRRASADLVTMTGNAAQAIVEPQQWSQMLRCVHSALNVGGYFVFETRNPAAEDWKNWTRDKTFRSLQIPDIGQVDGWADLTDVSLPLVSFRWTYIFQDEQEQLTSNSTLLFRTLEELDQNLTQNGFEVAEVREAPDRPGKEHVIIARKTS